MAYEYNDLKGLLFLVLIPLATSTNIDCNNKAFYCVNSTHFMICVDLGGRVTSTIDDLVIQCPPATICHEKNQFECEFPKIETTEPPVLDSIGKNVNVFIDSTTTISSSQITTEIPSSENRTDLPILQINMTTNRIGLLERIDKDFGEDKKILYETSTTASINKFNNSTELISANKMDTPFEMNNTLTTENDTQAAFPMLNKYVPLNMSEILEKIKKEYTDDKELTADNTSATIDKVIYRVEQENAINLNTNKSTSTLYKNENGINNITSKLSAEINTELPVIENKSAKDFAVIKNSNYPTKTKILEDIKKEYTEDKEMLSEMISITTIATIDNITETVIFKINETNDTNAVSKDNQISNISTKLPIEENSKVPMTENDMEIIVSTPINKTEILADLNNNNTTSTLPAELNIDLPVIENKSVQDLTVIKKDNYTNKTEILEDIKKEYTDGKETLFEMISGTTISTISYVTEPTTSKKENSIETIALNEYKNNRTSKISTKSQADEISTGPIIENNMELTVSTTPNKTEMLADLKNSNMTATLPAEMNIELPVIENPSVTDFAAIRKYTYPTRTEMLEDFKKEYTDGKEILSEMFSTTTIGTTSYITESANLKKNNINKNIAVNKDKIDNTRKKSPESPFKEKNTVNAITVVKNDKSSNKTEILEKINKENNTMLQINNDALINASNNSKKQVGVIYYNANKIPIIKDSYNIDSVSTASPMDEINNITLLENVTEIALPGLNKYAIPNKTEKLEDIRKEYIEGKEMLFEMASAAPITPVTYTTEPMRVKKIEILAIDEKYYETNTTTSKLVNVVTQVMPENNGETVFPVSNEDKSPRQKKILEEIKKEYTQGKEMVFDTAPTTVINFEDEQINTRNLNVRNLNGSATTPVMDKSYKKIDNFTSVSSESNVITFMLLKENKLLQNTVNISKKINKELMDGEGVRLETTSIVSTITDNYSTDSTGDLTATQSISVMDVIYNTVIDIPKTMPAEMTMKLSEKPVTKNNSLTGFKILNKDTAQITATVSNKITKKYADGEEKHFKTPSNASIATINYSTEQLNSMNLTVYNTVPVNDEKYNKIDNISKILVTNSLTASTKGISTNKTEMSENTKKEYADEEIRIKVTGTAPKNIGSHSEKLMDAINSNGIPNITVTGENYNKVESITIRPIEVTTEMPLTGNNTLHEFSVLNKDTHLDKTELVEKTKPQNTDGKEMLFKMNGSTPTTKVNDETKQSVRNLSTNESIPSFESSKIDDIRTVMPVITSTTMSLLSGNNTVSASTGLQNDTLLNKTNILKESKKEITAVKQMVLESPGIASLATFNYNTEQTSTKTINSIGTLPIIDEKYIENKEVSTTSPVVNSTSKLALTENITLSILENDTFLNDTKILDNTKKGDTRGKEKVFEITTPTNEVSHSATIEKHTVAISLNANETYSTGIQVQNNSVHLKPQKLNQQTEQEQRGPYLEELSTTMKSQLTEITLLTNEEAVTRSTTLETTTKLLAEQSVLREAQILAADLALTTSKSSETPTNSVKSANLNIIGKLYTVNVKQVIELSTSTPLSDTIKQKETVPRARKSGTQIQASTEFSTKYKPSSTVAYEEPLSKSTIQIRNEVYLPESAHIFTTTDVTQQPTVSDEPVHLEYTTHVTNVSPLSTHKTISSHLLKPVEPVISATSSDLSQMNVKSVTHTLENMMDLGNLNINNPQMSAVNLTAASDPPRLLKTATTEAVLSDSSLKPIEALSNLTVKQPIVVAMLPNSNIDKETVIQPNMQGIKIPFSKDLSTVIIDQASTSVSTGNVKNVIPQSVISNIKGFTSQKEEMNVSSLELTTANMTQRASTVEQKTENVQRTTLSPVVITALADKNIQYMPLNRTSSSVTINSTTHPSPKKSIATETTQSKVVIKTPIVKDVRTTNVKIGTVVVVEPTSINKDDLKSIKQPFFANTTISNNNSSKQYNEFALLNKYQNKTWNFNLTLNSSNNVKVHVEQKESLINNETGDGIVGKKVNYKNVINNSATEIYITFPSYFANSSQIELTTSNSISNNNKKRDINYTEYDPTTATKTNSDTAQKQILELIKSENEDTHTFKTITSTSSRPELSVISPAVLIKKEIIKPRNKFEDQESTNWKSMPTNINYKAANQTSDKSKSTPKETLNKLNLFCESKFRGKYADDKDCRKFYICVGNLQPIIGTCPNNTVFSEINKQCTRNLSHCIRNNQFHCLNEGRFIDFTKDNTYFICVKNSLHGFLRYKLQCQNGYHLNKLSVKCEENSDVSQSQSASESNVDQTGSKLQSGESKTSDSKNEMECKKEGKFPDSKNCRKYYVCGKNKKNELRRRFKTCSSDEVYDKDKKKCIVTESVEC